MKTIWNDKYISLRSKIRLMRSLVISVVLYCTPAKPEHWRGHPEKKLQVTEIRCFWKLLVISYRDRITNDAVGDRIRQAIGPYADTSTMPRNRPKFWVYEKVNLLRTWKYFEWITRQLLNSALVWCEELCRSRRMLSILFDRHNSSHPTQPHSMVCC